VFLEVCLRIRQAALCFSRQHARRVPDLRG
jgi:hypothetical protein